MLSVILSFFRANTTYLMYIGGAVIIFGVYLTISLMSNKIDKLERKEEEYKKEMAIVKNRNKSLSDQLQRQEKTYKKTLEQYSQAEQSKDKSVRNSQKVRTVIKYVRENKPNENTATSPFIQSVFSELQQHQKDTGLHSKGD